MSELGYLVTMFWVIRHPVAIGLPILVYCIFGKLLFG
jgi:hypothetical protein